jgi:hypothetical protein
MPSGSCCALAHAHPEGAPAHHAQVADSSLSVMLTQSGRWRGWLARVPHAISCPPRVPNQRLQSTPLRVRKIGAILPAPFCYNVITIYLAARLKRNMLGHTLSAHLASSMLLRSVMVTRLPFVFAATLVLAACSSLAPSATSITSSPPILTEDPFMGIPERIATTPFPVVSLPEQPDQNFAFSIGYGACTITRILDTFNHTLTQHANDGSSATVSFRLTSDERITIYQTIKTINLFGYPDVYVSVPENVPQIIPEPHPRYELVLQNGTLTKKVTWVDSIARPTTAQADRLREFIERIRTLVAHHPETAQLPPLNEGCA